MVRILVIALIIYLLLRIFKGWAANNKSTAQSHSEGEKMVRCEVCQLHIPESEAIQDNGKYYCCREHYNKRED